MAMTESYQVDIFGIVVLIGSVLMLVFLIIAAVYFYNLMNFKPPTKGESTFLFWTSIVLAVIFFAMIIYALYHIFTHRAILIETPTTVVKTTTTTPITTTQVIRQSVPSNPVTYTTVPSNPVTYTTVPSNPITTYTTVPANPVTYTTNNPVTYTTVPAGTVRYTTVPTNPVQISNVPQTTSVRNVSTTYSDIPLAQDQRRVLDQELINLSGSMG